MAETKKVSAIKYQTTSTYVIRETGPLNEHLRQHKIYIDISH